MECHNWKRTKSTVDHSGKCYNAVFCYMIVKLILTCSIFLSNIADWNWRNEWTYVYVCMYVCTLWWVLYTFLIGYMQICLPLYESVLVKQKFDWGMDFEQFLRKEAFIFDSVHVKYCLQWNVSSSIKNQTFLSFLWV